MPSYAETAEPPPATLAELKARVAEVLEERGVPAVGISLLNEQGEEWVGSLGIADQASGTAADADTLYRIGSTSKMFVALAVLRLVEQGRLSLDDRLVDLAPEIAFENPWAGSDPVRVAHLLEHTTGWDDIHLPEYAHNDPAPATLREGLDYHPHSRTSRWKPGTRMSYCNAGPPVAAYIVEKLTGLQFEEYVRFNFFDPMGMDTATYRLDDRYREKGATLYVGDRAQEYWHILMRPSGAINASPRDMAGLVRFFLDRGMIEDWVLLEQTSLERMERSETTSGARDGLETGYGLGNYASSFEHWVYRAHNGGVNGGLSELAYLPEAGVGHAIMINSDDGRALREISQLLRAYETRDLPVPDLASAADTGEIDRGIEGYYTAINPRQQLFFFVQKIFGVQRLVFDDGRLGWRRSLMDGSPDWFLPAGGGRYRSAETGRVALVRTRDPLAGEVVHSGWQVLKPVSAIRVFLPLALAAMWAVALLSSVVFFPVWGVRRLRGKIGAGSPVRVRLFPLFASFSVLLFLALFALGMGDPFARLGHMTVFSIGLMLFSILFAMFAAVGLVYALLVRAQPINRAVWWHSAVASSLHLLVAAYLLAHGIIGIATWS